jgi:hypothetical protein
LTVTKISADAAGTSHFGTESLDLQIIDPGRGIQPTLASAPLGTSNAIFFAPPRGAIVDWHPAPHRQLNIILSGTVGVEVADGERRLFKAGDVILLEDVDGKGHRTVVASDEDASFLAIQLNK